ncbi:uncharacterized protein TEOVI_000465900 [Trypanosoma equiperdum]|uniref:Uncharacterized protein n=1 Tax=Trypanosoma equiperdum TaxID=5694 RepID=A0A1G4I5A9_TRYEQ|nr:hypothetical protein, conserved [Trypanosoma equiperdum]
MTCTPPAQDVNDGKLFAHSPSFPTVSFAAEDASEDLSASLHRRQPRVSIFPAERSGSITSDSEQGGTGVPLPTDGRSPLSSVRRRHDTAGSPQNFQGNEAQQPGRNPGQQLASRHREGSGGSHKGQQSAANSSPSRRQHSSPTNRDDSTAHRKQSMGQGGGSPSAAKKGGAERRRSTEPQPRGANSALSPTRRSSASKGGSQSKGSAKQDAAHGKQTKPKTKSSSRDSSRSKQRQSLAIKAASAKDLSRTDSEAQPASGRRLSTVSLASRGSPRGKRGKKAAAVLVKNEETARKEIEVAQEEAFDEIMMSIFIHSFQPQRNLIKKLEYEMQKQKQELTGKLAQAKNSAMQMLEQVALLVDTVQKNGVEAMKESQILEAEVPFIHQELAPKGRRLSCVNAVPTAENEDERRIRRKDQEEGSESERIKAFFSADLYSSCSIGTFKDMRTDDIVSSVDKMCGEAASLSNVFSDLLNRTQRMINQSRQIIKAQQAALDECVTHVELADETLRDATEREKENIDYAFQIGRQFSMELRHRIDRIEYEMFEGLDEVIRRSTEVCCDAIASTDQMQRQVDKDIVAEQFMTRMELAAAEKAKLLRDVRSKLAYLWRRRLNVGSEERATLTYTGLPQEYQKSLELCDYDMLCRLIHFVSLNNDEARELFMGALDEHESFLKGNSVEAEIASQRVTLETAVRSLLRKLEDEGNIKVNPTRVPQTYEEKVKDLVDHYNIYMSKVEKQRRRILRRMAAEDALSCLPYFDRRRPVPEEYAADLDSRPGFVKPPAICNSLSIPKEEEAAQKVNVSEISRPPSFRIKRTDVGSFRGPTGPPLCARPPHDVEVAEIKEYLRRSHPSADKLPGPATVVGYGRWGGQVAQRPQSGLPRNSVTFSDATETRGPIGPLKDVQQPHRKPPPPMVPPRRALLTHVLEHHTHNPKAPLRAPNEYCTGVWGEDKPFVAKQVELLQKDIRL